MPRFELVTRIKAPVERVFDLSRSIDLHLDSTAETGEKAIAGVTSGLIGEGEEVTWRARHFGVWQTLSSKITVCDRPRRFIDVMQHGIFARLEHHHWFEPDPASSPEEPATIMRDDFTWASPLGVLGKIADALFVGRYLHKLLSHRNAMIKSVAESDSSVWSKYLP
jgi:ligand-binding SRPBCC domain-containing protein